MRKFVLTILLVYIVFPLFAQQIKMESMASLDQIYGTEVESETLLPMNDLDVEFGYLLYQAEITVDAGDARLEVENIRDYAVVYTGDVLQGTLTDSRKKMTLSVSAGQYTLRLYVENIGRITYGPEILDNLKGLFGTICLDGKEIRNWKITELRVRNSPIKELVFDNRREGTLPCFHKGSFHLDSLKDTYLDVSGWGMGEVWINGNYIGSYWEEERQQSIQVSTSILTKGENEVIVFELKNNKQESMQLSDTPVFK